MQQRGIISSIEAARATLNNLLSNPPETPVEIEQNYKQRSIRTGCRSIYNTAMSNRDEIVQATILIREGIEATKVANSALLPSASLAAKGQGRTMTGTFSILRATTIGRSQAYSHGLSICSGIIQRLRKRGEAVNELVLARQQLVQDISQNVKIAYLNMKTSEGNIDDYRRAVATQTENFRLFQVRYKQGDVSFTDVLIAENQLVAGKANYYSALIDYRINQAILERAMGILRR